ncbi:MAG: dTMP kinase [Caldiserica bacterium]|jgi:dTMP kinase|nr:dTMP kinase [Caldisericota bacterium]MDH7562246.1 dTMP kinase [Caldisericota bacterium]
MNGIFITLEGIDGTGKSTQASLIGKRLSLLGYRVKTTKEPGGTEIGSQIAKILLSNENRNISPKTEMFLFAADRAQHVKEFIKPFLEEGWVVVSSRYIDSTLAYQCWGHGLPLEEVKRIMAFATDNLLPHLTIVLDLEPEIALKRVRGDRLESEGLELLKKVRGGYLSLAAHNPERIKIVSAEGKPDEVLEKIWHWVLRLLEKFPALGGRR